VSRPINSYNLNYSVVYPPTPGPPNYNIVYESNYNIVAVPDTYGVNYNLAYPANYNTVYPVDSYNVTYPVNGYNIAFPPGNYNLVYPVANYNLAYPAGNYNLAYPAGNYNLTYPAGNYNVVYPTGNPVPTGTYNPATGVNYIASDYITFYFQSDGNAPDVYETNYVPVSDSGSNPICPANTYYELYDQGPTPFGNGESLYTIQTNYFCEPFGNSENYNVNYNIVYPVANYNIAYPVANYNLAYPVANYNLAYPAGNYNVAYPVGNYNVAYPVNSYNVAYPVQAYNVAYPIGGYNTVGVFSGYNTNYNLAYPIDTQPELSRPITGSNPAYNVAYPVTGNTAVYNIVYQTNYNIQPVVANYGANYSIVYQTNYNIIYPPGNFPEASRPVVGYSPGAPGTPTTVLGVYFPGGPVGLPAPYVPETVVRYWDYPDFQTHPVVVPSGGEIVVKLE
jgi:hypothetical protein